MSRQYELRLFQRKGNELRAALFEKVSPQETQSAVKHPWSIHVWGLPLQVMTETLLNTLKREGYRPTDFSPRRTTPFDLTEAAGVRLGLSFFALKPLRKPSRMEEILAGINRMSDEETYYWYAKCVNTKNAQRSRKALRILLAGE